MQDKSCFLTEITFFNQQDTTYSPFVINLHLGPFPAIPQNFLAQLLLSLYLFCHYKQHQLPGYPVTVTIRTERRRYNGSKEY